ncbi:MAG: hypothetical protein FWE98_00545 [Oscillospiraceae bacterium]|nr:hypothetical protein [Oscillospiraceae bacterium]
MKKLLALLLSAIILCSFGVGANAAPPDELLEEGLEAQIISAAPPDELTQEELDALGRELLIQTMEDLKGNYTIQGSFLIPYERFDFIEVIHRDDMFAFTDEDNRRDLLLSDRILRVYPNFNAYQLISTSNGSDYLPLLESKVISEDASVCVERLSSKYIQVSYDGTRYYFDNGSLDAINENISPRPNIWISSFNKEASQSAFSIEGMREASAQQIRLWQILEQLPGFILGGIGSVLRWIGSTLLNILLWPLNFLFAEIFYTPIIVWLLILPLMIIMLPINLIRRLFNL